MGGWGNSQPRVRHVSMIVSVIVNVIVSGSAVITDKAGYDDAPFVDEALTRPAVSIFLPLAMGG